MGWAEEVVDGLDGVECLGCHFDEDGVPVAHGAVPESREFESLYLHAVAAFFGDKACRHVDKIGEIELVTFEVPGGYGEIHGIEVAKVMLYESLRTFTDIDSILLSRLSRFVSMELQKNSFFSQNKGVMFSYFLADLLDSPEINYPSVRERLHILGFDLKEDLYMMTISASSYRDANAKLEVIVRELNNILVGSLYAIYENTLVMLFSRSRENGLSAYELTALENYLKSNSLTAGMSNFFTDLKSARRFYLQAKKAAEVGLRLQDEGPIHYYSDTYFYHIMEICEQEEDLQYFIHPAMMKLLYHDQERNSELLKTMHCFLQTPGNPAKIAEQLHIHKNTLLYRMNKIKSLTGCTLEDGDEIMSLGLSYKLMRYLKMLPEVNV